MLHNRPVSRNDGIDLGVGQGVAHPADGFNEPSIRAIELKALMDAQYPGHCGPFSKWPAMPAAPFRRSRTSSNIIANSALAKNTSANNKPGWACCTYFAPRINAAG